MVATSDPTRFTKLIILPQYHNVHKFKGSPAYEIGTAKVAVILLNIYQ